MSDLKRKFGSSSDLIPGLKVSIAQTCPRSSPGQVPVGTTDTYGQVKLNLLDTEEAVKAAAAQHSDMIVFPEYWLQGIVQNRPHIVHVAPFAVQFVQALAQRYNISIIGTIVESKDHNPRSQPAQSPFADLHHQLAGKQGAAIDNSAQWAAYIRHVYPDLFDSSPDEHESREPKREGDEKDLPTTILKTPPQNVAELDHERIQFMINKAYVIEAGTGRIAGSYVKKNLWIAERDYLTSAPRDYETSIVDLHGLKIGLMICWDMAHPIAAWDLAKKGADVIIAPTYWMATDSEPNSLRFNPPQNYEINMVQSLCFARSLETESAFLMCNAGGPASAGFAGGSGLWLPFKGKTQPKHLLTLNTAERDDSSDTRIEVHEVMDLNDILTSARDTYEIRKDWRLWAKQEEDKVDRTVTAKQ